MFDSVSGFSTQGFIEQLFSYAALTESAQQYSQQMVSIAAALIPTFAFIAFVYSYGLTTLRNVGRNPELLDRVEVIRPFILWIIVINYSAIFGSIESISITLARSTESQGFVTYSEAMRTNYMRTLGLTSGEEGAVADFETSAMKMINPSVQSDKEEGKDEGGGLMNIMGNLFDSIISAINSLVYTGALGLIFIIRIIVVGLALILGKIFYVIGPIALAFSVLPNNKEKARKWFNAWLHLLLVPFVANILNGFLANLAMNNSGFTSSTTGDPNVLSTVLLCAIIVTCYVLLFWVTSFIIGSADGGKVLSTAGALAAKGATSAAGAASRVFSSGAAASGGSGVPDVAKSGGAASDAKDASQSAT